MRKCATLVLGLLTAIAGAQDLAVVGARIEIGNGKVVDNGIVLVRSGKIAEIGANVKVPAGVPTVDGKGMVLYPGFINAYTTKGLKLPDAPAAQTPPSATNTAPPTMWEGNRKGIRAQVNAATSLNLGLYLKDAHAAGFSAAYLAPGGATIRGAGAFTYFTDEKTTPVPFGMEMGFRGGGAAGYPGTLLGVVSLLRQTLYDAQRYGQSTGLPKDADYEALQPVLKASTPAVFAADSEPDMMRAFSMGTEFGFPIVIQGGRDAYRRAKMLSEKRVPVLVDCAIGEEPSVKTSPDGPPLAVLQERRDVWKERSLNVLKLQEAGVPFAFMSERDGWDSYLKNIRKLISLGLPKSAALRAMTVAPAEIFGVSKEVGTVENGKSANFVLMSGDFADEKSTVRKVIVLGKVFDVAQEAAK